MCKKYDKQTKGRLLANVTEVIETDVFTFTFFSNEVKVTFFNYPFSIDYRDKLDQIINVPDLLTLSAMKAYALGKRAKWKDYVDLYFILKNHHTIAEIS